jgi:hypothetical protein
MKVITETWFQSFHFKPDEGYYRNVVPKRLEPRFCNNLHQALNEEIGKSNHSSV